MPILALLLSLPALADTPDALLKAGMAAQRKGDADLAIAKYEACLQQDPGAVGCHWEIGWSYWTKSDWAQVVAHWEKVKALDPQHSEVDKHLPNARAQLAAAQAVQKALADAPKTVRAPLPAGKTVRIRAVGDLMIGSDFPEPNYPPDEAAHVFDGVKDLLRDADVTFGNLEGPLCDGGTTNKCKEGQNCYAFRTPTRFVQRYVDAGFDVVSTANNHAEDFGVDCRLQTEAALDKAGIAYSGRPGTTASLDVDGVKVGLIGFHTSPNSHWVNDHEAAAALVKAMKASNDLVVVSFHGGAEGAKAEHVPKEMEVFYGEDRGDLRAFARAVIGAGADLVIGHGPHVLRGMEVVDGHLVAYSLGNFATFGRFNLTGPMGITEVLEVTLDHEGKFVGGKILPVKQVGDGIPEKDPSGAAIGKLRALSEEDFGAGAPLIGQDGSLAPRVR
ncbi:MAG: CapA family protein [Myxococcota bacterium]